MALEQATAGGEWLSRDEWMALCEESAEVIFRVLAHSPEKDLGNGPVFPVECELLILSGTRKGELHIGQSVIGKGLTTPLRKVKPGNDMVAVLAVGKNKAVSYPQANPPSGELFARASAMFADGRDPFVEAARAQNGTELVSAGAAPVKRPWE